MKIRIILSFSILLLLSCNDQRNRYSSPENLKCEYMVNPLGVDVDNPRFTWVINTERQGMSQRAFRIFLGTDSSEVAGGKGSVWASGTVRSSRIPFIFTGSTLDPFTRYYWSVKIQDENRKWSALSETAFFETGMMGQEQWKGQWLTDTHDYNLKPAPFFRKSFNTGKKIISARAYIATGGLYELFINGHRAGDHILDPMYTRFDRRSLYVVHDVTHSLQTGENIIGVILGNGWYNHQSIAVWYFDKAPWRARPKFCLDLHIKYDDGSSDVISSDRDWKTATGPIIFNSIYTAEHYDARMEHEGWDKPGFNDSSWKNAVPTGAPSQNIVSQILHPIRHTLELSAQEMTRIDKYTCLYNFGRNIAGVCRIKAEGPEGTIIRLKHAERLDATGRADLSNIDVHYRPTDDSDPFQTDIFILSGKGEETFMPRFNYKGFQYVEVSSDKPLDLKKESLTAYFMHSDVPPAGSIHSSNPVLNKTWQAANASYLSNLFGFPTDCPQREKNGWTGDAHINIETGLYNFDAITIYEKWLADHQDEQKPNGVLPAIIPTSGWGYHWANGPDWTSTIAIIPWNIYLFYGDSRLLESCYENIKRYVDYIDGISPTGLTDWGLGDWVPVKSITPKEFTSSIYFYVDAQILAKAAKIFGKEDEFQQYSSLAEKIKNALNAKYLNRQTGIYGSGVQTEQSAALKWGLVPEELIPEVAKNLAERVLADGSHIDVGLLGTKTILNALSENGYSDLAYTLASNETFPSWGWWIVNGATTFYENWPLDASRDISMNHIMFGEVSAWYYKALGGIFPDEQQPGFKNVVLKPNFVKGLDHFEAKYNGPYGLIISSWEKTGSKVIYNVSIPPNSAAVLYLTANEVLESEKSLSENKMIRAEYDDNKNIYLYLKSGEFRFTIRQ